MGLLDIIRKLMPKPTPNDSISHRILGVPQNRRALASPAEFITACLLTADLPLPQSEQDEARKNANVLAVSIFRRILDEQPGPSAEISDASILDIYRRVGCAFREVGKERSEFIKSAVINRIVLYFLTFYSTFGPDNAETASEQEGLQHFFEERLQNEIETYRQRGLPDYFQKPLPLFDD